MNDEIYYTVTEYNDGDINTFGYLYEDLGQAIQAIVEDFNGILDPEQMNAFVEAANELDPESEDTQHIRLVEGIEYYIKKVEI